MNKGTVLALLVVVLGGGIGLGKMLRKDRGNCATASTAKSAIGDERARRGRRRRRPRPRAARGRSEGAGATPR